MRPVRKSAIIAFALSALGSAGYTSAHAQSARDELHLLSAQLQKTPNDSALREKAINLALTLKPAPIIPEEAREPFVMGATVLKLSGSPAEASKAVDLFTKAIQIAPWFADAYYNRAVARETAGQFEPAMDDLRLYLLFKLSDQERRDVQDKIYALKAQAQVSVTKKAEEERIAREKLAAEKAKLDFSGRWGSDHSNQYQFLPEPGGTVTILVTMWNGETFTCKGRIEGRKVSGAWPALKLRAANMCPSTFAGTLSEDGLSLQWSRSSYCGGDPMHLTSILTRQGQ